MATVIDATIQLRNNTLANRTNGNVVGEAFFATDTKQLFLWDGSQWNQIGGASGVSLAEATALAIALG